MIDIHELFWQFMPAQEAYADIMARMDDLTERPKTGELKDRLYAAACTLLDYECIKNGIGKSYGIISAEKLVMGFLGRVAS